MESEFSIAQDVNNDSTWFIYNVETFSVLNIDDINDSAYRNLFNKRGEDDHVVSTFNNRENAQKVFDNLKHIYIK